jgi:hypothetical protein
MLPVTSTALRRKLARRFNSMLAARAHFYRVGSIELCRDIGDFCHNYFARQAVANKNHFALMSSDTEAAISNPQNF